MQFLKFHLKWVLISAFAYLSAGAEPVDNRASAVKWIPHASQVVAAPFFDPQTVQTIHLELKEADLERLKLALPKRITVPGTFRWNDKTVENVGVRYKGNSSSDPNAQHKRSFLVDFPEYDKHQRFLGLRQVALDNGVQFGSLFSERLITDILRELGVKSSRCNYARLFVNGRYLGVYVNVERVDETFVERNFKNGKGVLLKVDEGGPGGDLRFLGEDIAQYEKTFELHAGEKNKAHKNLVEFIRLINDSKLTEYRLRTSFEVDSFLTTTAVLLFAGAFDQYTGWNPHNYFLHQSPQDGRWSYIPWDLDVGFADKAFGQIPVLQGWNAAWPAPASDRPLMEQIMRNPNLLRMYREKAHVILETYFRPEILIPKLRTLHDQIKQDLILDPFPHRRATVPGDSNYEGIVASIESFIRERYILARSQLDRPGARPQFARAEKRETNDGPKPGPASADAPSDLKVGKVTSSSVELSWVDRAEGEVAFVVQKCIGADATDFRNAIGQGGQNITTARDNGVQPGKTYRYRVYAVHPTPTGPRGTGVSNVVTVEVPSE